MPLRSTIIIKEKISNMSGVRVKTIFMLWAFIVLILVIGCWENSNSDHSSSLFPVKVDGKWGYIDSTGSIVGEIKYEGLSFISEGFGIAYAQNTWSVIDQKGKAFFVASLDSLMPVGNINEGVFKVASKEGYGYFLTVSGEEMLKLDQRKFHWTASEFNDERLVVSLENGDFGILNRSGKLLYQTGKYRIDNYSEKVARAYNSEETCYLNHQGELLYCFRGRGLTFSEGGFFLKDRNETKFINKDGSIRFYLETVQDMYSFSEGLAMIKKEELWGYIDKHGKVSIPNRYSSAHSFHHDLAFVREQGTDLWSIIDKKGSIVVDKKIKDMAQPFFEGALALVKVDDTWCYMNRKGEIVWKNMPSPYSETQWSIPPS